MRRWWPLAAILLVYATAVGLSVGWGLPGERRVELVFPGGLTKELVTEMAARAEGKLSAQAGRPIPLRGEVPEAPAWDRGEALDACRRFLLYTDNPDEMLSLMALANMHPSELDFDPRMGQYGGAFLYPLGAWLKGASLVGAVHEGDLAYYLARPEEFARVYVAGRLFVALCVALAVVAAYRFGLRLGGVAAAATAAGLVALAPATLTWSVVLKPHAVAMLPGVLAAGWALAYCQSGRRRTLVASALAAGIAAAMTMSALPVLAAPIVAALVGGRATGNRLQAAGTATANGSSYRVGASTHPTCTATATPSPQPLSRQGRGVQNGARRDKPAVARLIWAAMVVAAGAAAFLVVNPYHVIAFGDRLREATHVRGFYSGSVSLWQPVAFWGGPLREAVGLVFLCLSVLAAVWLLMQHARRAAVLYVPVALAVIFMPLGFGSWAGEAQMARFALSVLPLAMLGLGWWVGAAGPLVRRAAPAMVVLMAALALPTVHVQLMSSLGQNPRYEAGRWLNHHPAVPLVVEYPAAPYRNPPVDWLHREVMYAPDSWRPYVTARTVERARASSGGQVFRLGRRPWWLRAPMTFADRDVEIELHFPPAAAARDPAK